MRSGVSPDEGAGTGTLIPDESKARAPEQPGASPHPGAAFARCYHQDQEFELCCRELVWQELRQESGGCGL